MLSYGFWQESFGGRENVCERPALDLDNEKYDRGGSDAIMVSRSTSEAQVFVPLDMTLERGLARVATTDIRPLVASSET